MAKSLIPGADDWKKKRGIKTESETPSLKINGKATSEVAKDVTAKHSAPQKKTAAQSTAERSLPNIKYNFTGAKTQQKPRSLFGDVTGADFAKSGLRRVTDYATAKTRADYDENLRRIGLTRNADKDKLRREAYKLFEQQSRYDMYDFDIQNLSNVSQKLRAFKITKENLKEYEKLKKEYEQANARFNVAMAAKQQARERLLRKQEKEADKELKASVTEYLKQNGRFTAEPQKKESPYKSVEVGNKYFDRLMKNFSNDNPLSRINEAQAQADYLERDYKRRADEITKERTALESEYERLSAGNGTPGEIESFNKRVSDFNGKAAKLESDAVLYNGKIKDINENFKRGLDAASAQAAENFKQYASELRTTPKARKIAAENALRGDENSFEQLVNRGIMAAQRDGKMLPVQGVKNGKATKNYIDASPRSELLKTIDPSFEDYAWTKEERETYYAYYAADPQKAEAYKNLVREGFEEKTLEDINERSKKYGALGAIEALHQQVKGALLAIPVVAEYGANAVAYAANKLFGANLGYENRATDAFKRSQNRAAAAFINSENKAMRKVQETVLGFGQNMIQMAVLGGISNAAGAMGAGAETMANALPGGTSLMTEQGIKTAQKISAGMLNFFYGGSTAGQEFWEAKERGASDGQAILSGAVKGMFEAVFNNVGTIPIINNIGSGRVAKGTSGNFYKRMLSACFKEGLGEFGEEFATQIAQELTDAVVMGDISNYNAYVDALKKQGYGEEDANMKALWELYGRAPLEAGFSGFVMGALSGAMVNTSNVFEAGKYADAEKIGEYLKGELNQNYMGETGKAAASLRADAIKGLKTARNTQNPVRAAWNMGRAATGAAELADMPKLIINSDSVYRDINEEAQNKIETTKDGKKYVKADRQVIFTNNPDNWGKELEAYINDEIRRGQDVNIVTEDGDVLKITADTAWKIGDMHGWDEEAFPVKMDMGTHIDELAQVSRRTNARDASDRSNKRFQPDKFEHRTAFFEDFDGTRYRIYLSAGVDKNGKTVYSIGKNIKRRSSPGSLGPSANRRRSSSGAPSSNSIRENGEKYNSNFNQNNKWTFERIAQLDNAVKKSRVNIIIEDIPQAEVEGNKVRQGAYYRNANTIVIDPRVSDVQIANTVLFHELAHSTEGTKYYDEFKNYIKGIKGEEFITETEKKMKSLRLSREEAESEAVADFVKDIFRGGTEEMNGFLARNYTAAREITDTMKNIIDSVKIRFGVEPSSVYERAVRSFEKALAKRETGGETTQYSDRITEEDIRYSTGEVSPEEKARLLREEEERRKEYGSKGGYEGHSMSRRAAEAYSSGEKPISKWTKSEILTGIEETAWDNDIDIEGIDFSKLTTEELKSKFLRNSSWHHTGSFYNATDFYEISAAAVAETTQEDIERIISGRTRRQLTNAERAEKAMNKKALEEAKEVYKKIKFIYDCGVTNYKSANTLFRRYANDDLDLDGLYKKAVKKTGWAEDAYKLERVSNDKGLATVKNRILEDYEAKGGAMLFETREDAVIKEKYNSNFNQDYQGKNVKNSTGEVSPEEKARLIKEDREKRNIERYGEEAGKVINSLERNLKEARRQLTPTTEAAVRESDVRALADDYIKSGVDMGKDELAGRLAELYNKMLYGNEKITGAEAYAEARTIATDMMKKTADVYFESELRDFRKEVKSFKLTISKEDAKDIADWGEWKKEQGSALHVVLQKEGVEGTPVDSAYTELAERFPYLLSGDAAAPSDMLFEIADAVKETQRYKTDFGMDPKEYRNALAEDILENFFEVRQTAPTAADKFQKRLESRDRKIRELRADRDAKLEALKEKNNARIEKILEREKEFREMTAEQRITARESRRKNEEIASIRRVYNILARKTVKPTDKSHHVHGIEGAVADFLSLIDPTSTKSKDTGKAHEKISALREKIFEAANNISGPYAELIDPDLQRNIEYLREAIENKHIDEYTRKERQTLLKVLYAIWKFDTNVDATLSKRLDRKISDLGRLVIDENQVKKGKEYSVKNRQMKRVESFFRTDMLDSLRFFKRLGPTMSMLYEGLTEGRDDYIRKYDSGVQYYRKVMKEFLEDTGDKGRIYGAYKRLSREASKIKLLSGDTIYVTKAQAMSLYELNKREQAREHIYKGGLRFTEQEKASTEKKGEKYRVTAENYYVTPEDVYNITNILTPKEKALADRLTSFFGETAKWGNAVSLKLYGYEKFRERNYFPIEVNKNVLYSDPTQSGEALTKNMGAAKSTVDKASNAINLRNIFDVYADTVNNMANYGSMVLPIEDIRRVWNYKSKDRNGEVKTNLENKFGTSVLSYFDDFIRDIGRGITTPRGDGLANLLLSKAKGAAVGLNISVAVQQPLSIIRASTAINPKYLMRGALMKGDYELIKKYAPIAIWKQYGFFDVDTKPYAAMDIFNDRKTLSDIEGFMSQAGDEAAWKAMWNAAALETAAKNKNMVEKGKVKPEFQEKFYNIVGKRFTQIIDETQVVDTVFNRTGLMRSKSFGAKTATAFMSEPAKEYNVFAGKLMDFAQADNKKAARTALAGAAVCLVISKLATNAVKSLVGALRDDKKEKYKEKYIAKLKDNLQGEVFGSIPYLSTLQNIISGYGAENMAWSNIADFVESLKAVGVIKDEYNDGTNKSKINAWADVASTLASVFGRPTKTVKRDLISVAMAIGRAAGSKGNHEFEYSVSKLFYDPASNATKNKDIFFGILNDAVNDEDNEAIDSISKDLGKYNDIYLQNAAMKAYYRKERLPYEDKAKEFNKKYDNSEVKTGKRLDKSYYSYLENMEKNFFGAARLSSAEQKKEAAGLYKEMINAPRSVNATVDNEVNRLLDASDTFHVSPYYTAKGTVDKDGITRQLSPKQYLEMQKEAIERIYTAYEKVITSEGYANLEDDKKKAAALEKVREAAADRVSYEAFIKDGADFLKKLMTGEDMTLYKSRNNTKTAAKYLEAMEPFTGGTLESNTALYAYKNADSYMNYMEKHSLLTAEAAQKMNEYAIKRSKAITRGDAARFGKVNETAYLFDAESIFKWTVNGNEFGIEPTPEQAYNAYILFDKDLDTALQRAYANGFYTAKGSRATYTDKYGNKQPAIWQQMPPDKLTEKIGKEKTRVKEKIRSSMQNSGKVNWYETMPDGTIVRHR